MGANCKTGRNDKRGCDSEDGVFLSAMIDCVIGKFDPFMRALTAFRSRLGRNEEKGWESEDCAFLGAMIDCIIGMFHPSTPALTAFRSRLGIEQCFGIIDAKVRWMM